LEKEENDAPVNRNNKNGFLSSLFLVWGPFGLRVRLLPVQQVSPGEGNNNFTAPAECCSYSNLNISKTSRFRCFKFFFFQIFTKIDFNIFVVITRSLAPRRPFDPFR